MFVPGTEFVTTTGDNGVYQLRGLPEGIVRVAALRSGSGALVSGTTAGAAVAGSSGNLINRTVPSAPSSPLSFGDSKALDGSTQRPSGTLAWSGVYTGIAVAHNDTLCAVGGEPAGNHHGRTADQCRRPQQSQPDARRRQPALHDLGWSGGLGHLLVDWPSQTVGLRNYSSYPLSTAHGLLPGAWSTLGGDNQRRFSLKAP